MKIINLFGGPGISKSTTASGLFYEMKKLGYNVELGYEYAKILTYDGNMRKVKNQFLLFAKQYEQIDLYKNNVDYFIMDSPLLLSIIYNLHTNPYLNDCILHEHNTMDNLNYILNRQTIFEQNGRYHNSIQSIEIDNKIENLLLINNISFSKLNLDKAIENILTDVKKKLPN